MPHPPLFPRSGSQKGGGGGVTASEYIMIAYLASKLAEKELLPWKIDFVYMTTYIIHFCYLVIGFGVINYAYPVNFHPLFLQMGTKMTYGVLLWPEKLHRGNLNED